MPPEPPISERCAIVGLAHTEADEEPALVVVHTPFLGLGAGHARQVGLPADVIDQYRAAPAGLLLVACAHHGRARFVVQTYVGPFEFGLDSVTLLPYSCTESSDMENNLENLTIGVFAKAAGVNVETIRFYQRKGLLREPDKPYGSIRRYGEADVVRVKFVKSAQRLGFSLDEIAELLRLDDGTHCEEASSLAEHKLKDVREKMADLARMETVLSELVCACHARKGNVSCPLIASLQGEAGLARSAMP